MTNQEIIQEIDYNELQYDLYYFAYKNIYPTYVGRLAIDFTHNFTKNGQSYLKLKFS